jgi:ABC-type amino acid transport substrate-binding protein
MVFDDLPIAAHFAKAMRLARPVPLPGTQAQYAYMFAKSNDRLRRHVNDSLRSLREEGTWLALRERWWPSDSAAEP